MRDHARRRLRAVKPVQEGERLGLAQKHFEQMVALALAQYWGAEKESIELELIELEVLDPQAYRLAYEWAVMCLQVALNRVKRFEEPETAAP